MKQLVLYKTTFHLKNIPTFMQENVRDEFMAHYGEVVEIFNDNIREINRKWDQTGKPAFYSDDGDDINPEYVDLIRNEIQPEIDVLNRQFPICKYRINDCGGAIIEGYLPSIRKSKIYITLEPIES